VRQDKLSAYHAGGVLECIRQRIALSTSGRSSLAGGWHFRDYPIVESIGALQTHGCMGKRGKILPVPLHVSWTAKSGRSQHWASLPLAGRKTIANEIQTGSRVKLKSGGSDTRGSRWVRCSWFDDTKRMSQTFELEAVELTWIWAFCSTVQLRRRPAPVNTSSRRTGSGLGLCKSSTCWACHFVAFEKVQRTLNNRKALKLLTLARDCPHQVALPADARCAARAM
jgi:uncharacterized protein YodC (DUF2158 family)